MIRPWYRSRLFWLGIPGLVFLLWAWRDSSTRNSELFWSGRMKVHGVSQYLGSINLFHLLAPWDTGPKRFDVRRMEYPKVVDESYPQVASFTFPQAIVVYKRPPANFSERGIRVSHWLIALGYVLVWCLAVGLWQRRKARLLEATVPEPS